MINLGTVKPGRTLRIPFSTFDKDDGSSITMTGYAVADILIYKDGSTTERASTSGFTATTDFDSKTGKHVIVIDLADNTTADFFAAGSEYLVAINAVTVDAVTTGGWVARFDIGYPGAILDTTIATLASQTSFTLTSGPAEDDALNGHYAIIHDAASAVQLARVLILDYTGSTKTVTLVAGATFTVAAKDNFSVMDMAPMQPTVLGRTLDISTGGEAGLDWANVGSPTTTLGLTNTTIGIVTLTNTLTTYTGNTLQTGDSFARIGAAGAGLTNIDLPNQTMDIIGNITGSLSGSVGSVSGLTAANLDASITSRMATYTQPTGFLAATFPGGTIANTTNITAGVMTTTTNLTNMPTIPTGWITAAGIADNAIDTTTFAAGTTVPRVTLVDTTTTNTDMRGTDSAATAANLATVAAYLDTEIAAILADTNELQVDWVNGGRLDLILDIVAADTTTDIPALIAAEAVKTAAIQAVTVKLNTGLVIDGAVYQWTANALELAPAGGGGGGSGTGARTVTITVNDGATVLENALIRMTEGANTYTALTNVSGVAVFNLDDATYTVSITKYGYTYSGTTLIVNGTETATYSMTVIVVTPPTNPALSALEILCVDSSGEPEVGVEVDIRIVTVPSGDVNVAYKGAKQTATSDVDGLARFEAVKLAVYEYKRGTAQVWERVTIGSGASTNVSSFIGSP